MASYEVKQNLFLGVGTILNTLVIALVNLVAAYYLLIYKKSTFSRKQYNNFLMGLQAVMGIFLALTGYTWTAVAHLAGEWPAENLGCSLATFCLLFFGTMMVMVTLVMSAERFIAMCVPFYYQQLINLRKIRIAVGYIFVHSAALAILPLLLKSVELTKNPIAVCLYSLNSKSNGEVIVVHAFICNFSLSILLMLVMNVSVLKALKRMNFSVGTGVLTQSAGDREAIILSNLTGIMALSYSLAWVPTLARVMLIYHANWRSIYFDLFAFGLSTVDPFVHPVTCILVSRRYRAGYADAFKDIVSRIRGWICSFKPPTRVDPLDYTPNVSNTYNSGLIHVTWQHESRVNLRNNCDNSPQCPTPKAHASVLRLDVIQET